MKYTKLFQAVSLTTSEGTTPVIRHNGIQLALKVAASASLTFWGCATEDGTFRKIRRRTSVDTNFTAFEDCTMAPDAAGIYPIPDETLCVPYVKIVAGSAADVEVLTLGEGVTREIRS